MLTSRCRFDVCDDISYQELLVCYIEIQYNILKFNFVRFAALELDQSFINDSSVCSLKCRKDDEICEF